MFEYEKDVAGLESFYNSDIMISDWSGAAIEYAFGLNKPVIFLDIPKKINNHNYKEIDVDPFEVSIREKIGIIIAADKVLKLPNLNTLVKIKKEIDLHKLVFNLGKAHKTAKYLLERANFEK